MYMTFAQMGFTPTVTAASAAPTTDGYFGTLNGMPYGIHPSATPTAYAALVVAIAASAVTVEPYGAPVVVPPTLAQLATTAYAEFIANGLTVTSTGTPALNGVYALDPETQSDIAVEAQFISTFGEFTNEGTADLLWPLQNGTEVTFPTTAEFLALAKVSGQKVAAGKLAVGQASATMPVATATIP